MMRSTYTVAELPISRAAFDEIARLLRESGIYDGQFMEDELIDMSGLAISPQPEPDDA